MSNMQPLKTWEKKIRSSVLKYFKRVRLRCAELIEVRGEQGQQQGISGLLPPGPTDRTDAPQHPTCVPRPPSSRADQRRRERPRDACRVSYPPPSPARAELPLPNSPGHPALRRRPREMDSSPADARKKPLRFTSDHLLG